MMLRDFDWKNPSWVNLFITIPWGIGVLVAVQAWSADHQIAQRQRTTTGMIAEHITGRSDRYRYKFSVDAANFEGSSGSDDRHIIGDQVTVFYDASDPNTNALRDYGVLAVTDLGLVPLLLTGIGGVSWCIWYVLRQKKASSGP